MKKFTALLIVILMLIIMPLSASADFEIITTQSEGIKVITIQKRLRDLGFLSYRATGTYGTMTRVAVMNFQAKNGISADGSVGEQTYKKLFSGDLVRGPMTTAIKSYSGPSMKKDPEVYGTLESWSKVKDIFSVNSIATITDLNSGKTFSVRRTGGQNNAWVETISEEDYSVFLASFGGGTSYEKRSVLVTVGSNIYAGSLFGWPHGEDKVVSNGMDGHLNLFFKDSRSDVLNLADPEHEEMVDRAAGMS